MTLARVRRPVGAASVLLILVMFLVGPARAQEVFFGPIPDQPTPNGFVVDPDFPALFAQPSAWPGGLARIAAMLYRTRYIQGTSDDTLRQQFAFLASQHVAVALVAGVVEASGCGHGIEGMVYGPNVNPAVAKRIAALGADVRYLIADEPFTFGHKSMLPGACQYTIAQVADQFAHEVAGVRQSFPDIQVIDNEAASRLQVFDEVAQWVDALRAALGPKTKLTMGLDVQWQSPWTDWAPQIVRLLAAHGLRFGVLVHGIGQDKTDAAWLDTAASTARAWEAIVADRPRHVAIQSWNANPTHVLPETDPTSMTSLILTWCALTHWKLACHGLH